MELVVARFFSEPTSNSSSVANSVEPSTSSPSTPSNHWTSLSVEAASYVPPVVPPSPSATSLTPVGPGPLSTAITSSPAAETAEPGQVASQPLKFGALGSAPQLVTAAASAIFSFIPTTSTTTQEILSPAGAANATPAQSSIPSATGTMKLSSVIRHHQNGALQHTKPHQQQQEASRYPQFSSIDESEESTPLHHTPRYHHHRSYQHMDDGGGEDDDVDGNNTMKPRGSTGLASITEENTVMAHNMHHHRQPSHENYVPLDGRGEGGAAGGNEYVYPSGMSMYTDFWGSVANLCSATLGAGALSMPFALKQSGWVCGIVLLVGTGLTNMVSIDVLARCSETYNLHTYEALVETLFGKSYRTAVEISILIFCLGSAVACVIAVGDTLEQSHLLIFNSRGWTMTLWWTITMLPLSMFRRVQSLQFSSALSILSTGLLVAAAGFHLYVDDDSLQQGQNQQRRDESSNHTLWENMQEVMWPSNGISSVLVALPIVLYAYSCQTNVCGIFEELPPNTSSPVLMQSYRTKADRMSMVGTMATWVCGTLYLGTALVALADFGAAVKPNMLNSYQPVGLMQLGMAWMAAAVIFTFPVNVFPARVTIAGLLWPESLDVSTTLHVHDDGTAEVVSDTLENPTGSFKSVDEETSEPAAPPPPSVPAPGKVDTGSVVAVSSPHLSAVPSPRVEGGHHHRLHSGHHAQHEDGLSYHVLESQEVLPTQLLVQGFDLFQTSVTVLHEPVLAVPSTTMSWWQHVSLTVGITVFSLVCALVAPNISVVFGFLGGTTCSLVGFIMPGAMGLRMADDIRDGNNPYASDDEGSTSSFLMKNDWLLRSVSWFLLVGGIVAGILTTALTVYSALTDDSS